MLWAVDLTVLALLSGRDVSPHSEPPPIKPLMIPTAITAKKRFLDIVSSAAR
ncbi:MAG: hypothetical protein ACI87E_002645 [Mariniblastus sp.]|jgi:hypothetical protein